MSSEDIAARVRAGAPAIFEEIFRTYYTNLVRIAFAMVHSMDAAEDIVCDVFENFMHRHADWDATVPIGAYLGKAVRNRALNLLRDEARQNHLRMLPDISAAASVEEVEWGVLETLETEDREKQLARALHDLPETARLLLNMRWQLGLPVSEIALIMSTTPESISVQLSRALKTLKTRLQVSTKKDSL